jgi:hypothetical protein
MAGRDVLTSQWTSLSYRGPVTISLVFEAGTLMALASRRQHTPSDWRNSSCNSPAGVMGGGPDPSWQGSVVVDVFDSIGAANSPGKPEAELLVEADAVLACAITPQGLQPVTQGTVQVLKMARELQLPELAGCHAPK